MAFLKKSVSLVVLAASSMLVAEQKHQPVHAPAKKAVPVAHKTTTSPHTSTTAASLKAPVKNVTVQARTQAAEKKQVEPVKSSSDWSARASLGYGWTTKAGIENPDLSYWDAAGQDGYDATLGSGALASFGIDTKIPYACKYGITYKAGLEMNILEPLMYRKYQSGALAGVGGTGARRMRFFDVRHMSFMLHGLVQPKAFKTQVGSFAPEIDFGLGLAANNLYNFQTVAYKANIGTDTGAGSVTSVGFENEMTMAFAGRVGLGFEFKPNNCESTTLHVGYRYYWGGKFVTPGKIMLNTDGANEQGALSSVTKAWEGAIGMHQLVCGLEINF